MSSFESPVQRYGNLCYRLIGQMGPYTDVLDGFRLKGAVLSAQPNLGGLGARMARHPNDLADLQLAVLGEL